MFDLIVESSFRSVVAAAGVGLLLSLFRARDPALRHTAWMFVLATTIAMPLLVASVPELTLPVLPAPEGPAGSLENAARVPMPVGQPTNVAVAESDAESPWTLVYLATACIFLVRIAVGYGMGIRLVRAAEGVDPRGLEESLPGVRYRSSSRFTVPMTFGWVFPVVFLPREFRNWNIAKQRAVLDHEHAHIRRRDFLTNLIASVTRAAYWMNPLAWWLERHVARLAEEAADEIAAGRDRRSYAEILIEIAESAGPNRIRGVAMTRHSGLGKRIENLSNGRSCMKPSTRTRTWTLTLGILALVGAASCMTPTRAASGSSFTGAAQEEAESRAVLEQELRELEAELERARVREIDREAAAQLEAELAARAVQRQTDVQREFERQLALEEIELERSVVRQQTLEELRRLREVETAQAQQISEARQAYERARARFTEDHPAYIAAQARLEALQSGNADEELRRILERLRVERIVEEQSIEDQIREAERQVNLAREQLRANEERLRMLMDQRETQEAN